MKYLTTKQLVLSGFLAIALSHSSEAAAVAIDSITSSGGAPSAGGTLQSITVGATSYTALTAPATLSSSAAADYVSISEPVPTTVEQALGGLNLDTGALNYHFTVQFGKTVVDTDLFFLINHSNSTSTKLDTFVIQAIDSGGGTVGSATTFPPTSAAPKIVTDRDWLRTGGTTLTSREMYGVTFSLDDLGLAGNTSVTGFILTDDTSVSGALDPAVVGLASIPESSALALAGLAGLMVGLRRRR